jgi:hypothetical protein
MIRPTGGTRSLTGLVALARQLPRLPASRRPNSGGPRSWELRAHCLDPSDGSTLASEMEYTNGKSGFYREVSFVL